MNHWLDTSVRNMLPLSRADIFMDALREWYFTGTVIDCEDDDNRCELCEHPDLSHHFEIRNAHTDHSLLVGSSCILKFSEIEIRDSNGDPIADPAAREFALKQALRARVIESGLEALRRLWVKDKINRSRIAPLAKTLKADDGISPIDLLFLLNEMNKRGIQYQAKNYKVSLRTLKDKGQFSLMDRTSVLLLLPALSQSQLTKVRTWRQDV